MKYLVVPFGAIAIAIVLWTVPATRSSAAPQPTPTAVAIGYDEINRSAMMGGTPPPPGQFLPDYQAIMAAAPPAGDSSAATPAPKRRGGLGGMIGNLGNLGNMGAGGPGGMQDPMAAMNAMKLGTLKRYTYYWRHQWVRIDDPVQQTATIEKCNEHEFIYLNLAKKTYRTENTTPKTCDSPASPFGGHGRPGAQPNMEPGTSVISMTNNVAGLGPMTLESIPTHGFDNNLAMSMTEATGSCNNMSMKMDKVTYYSQIGDQHAYCPIAGGRASGGPEQAMAQGGCKPKIGKMTGGGGEPSDKLYMYQRMTMDMQGHPFSTVTERGHVDWYLTPDADALFTIPPGYTQETSQQ